MNLLNHEPGLFVWEIISFLIFLVLLRRMAWKPLRTYLEQRQNKISDALASSQQINLAMIQLKQEHEIMKAKVYEEIADMQRAAREYTSVIVTEAREKAKIEYERALDEARAYVEKLKNNAISEIKSKTGVFAIEIAMEIVRKELTSAQEQENHILRLIGSINFNQNKY